MGLPCPNLFTGEMAFHGKHEYVCVQDMEKVWNNCVACQDLGSRVLSPLFSRGGLTILRGFTR